MSEPGPEILRIESVVSSRDFSPHVKIRWGEQGGQLTPGEARRHAMDVLAAAEAAEHDSAVARWVTAAFQLDAAAAAAVLGELREFRGMDGLDG